jgi:UDP-glucose 4-epimerase
VVVLKIFVTGGAGYIGSQVVKDLGEEGHDIVVYDNLSAGHAWAVLSGRLIVGDLADKALLKQALMDCKPDIVMHFAAHIRVEESVQDPLKYYRNNSANALNLLEAMGEAGINKLVFSSTAAVYGTHGLQPVSEDAPINPVNPYGASKVMVEYMLHDLSIASGFRYVSLRYFNVAGADGSGRLGQSYSVATHLITRALKAAKREISGLQVFGTDYPTADGTCVRDYIHVEDLSKAHSLALQYLENGGASRVYNCGYGHGYSVREIVSAVKKITGADFPVESAGRRPGDPPVIIADSARLRNELDWRPAHDDLDYIVKTAWEWERRRSEDA